MPLACFSGPLHSSGVSSDNPDILASALGKARRRLLPFLLLLYILAFLDRVNMGFAKVAFMSDTGLGESAYAFGAAVFFAGYAVLEVPSNLLMHRFGARAWMCRIMVTWGLISAAMMFAWTEGVFYTLRFLLGVAEAGFFPGVIYFLTHWFPAAERGRVMGLFYFGAPLAFIIGGPVSGLLLEMHGAWGLRGWQWMFLIEGLLASAVGVWTFFYLNNHPKDAAWLSPDERIALQTAVDAEESAKSHRGGHRLLPMLRDPRVLLLCAIYLLIQASVYGVTFYLPSQVERLLGRSAGLRVGLVTAIPWICALIAAWAVPRFAVASGKSKTCAIAALIVAGLGIAASTTGEPVLALVALCFAAAGFIGVQPVFWTYPTQMLGGAAAAGGIALINSCGAVGGYIAPQLRTWAGQHFQSPGAGLWALAITAWLAAALFAAVRKAD